MDQADWLLNARMPTGQHADIHIVDGRIEAVLEPAAERPSSGGVDVAGALVVPSFIDGHIHLDKTLLGLPFMPHRRGASVADRIALEKQIRADLTLSVSERGARLIETIVPLGTGRVRSHVDIDLEAGLSHLEQLLGLRERFAGLLDIQIVAFPQSGILRSPGVEALLDEALRAGADLVGGLDPALIDGDVSKHLDIVFGLGDKHGVGVDIHLHEPGQLGLFTLREIAARTRALGLPGRVAVSHAFSLGEALDIAPTLDALAEAGVAIATNAPGPVPMPPVKRLASKGILVFAGSDNIRDAWSPYGNGDMLERAGLVGYRQGLLADEDIDLAFAMITTNAAKALGVGDYGVVPGASADLVVLDATSVPEAVAGRAARRLVLKSGNIVARDGALTVHGR